MAELNDIKGLFDMLDYQSLIHSPFAFVGFFFAGLAMNLTPCVYPMLTVTASLFKIRKASHPIKSSFLKALAYFLGIVIMYSALGYFAASTGKLFGSVLQNRWVLFLVGSLMLGLSLSMFGVFQLQVPSSWLNKIGGMRKADYFGLFLSGVLVGIFAAPCIGPPVIALLTAVANDGNPQFGLLAFFVFACGLGLPYLLLGTFSGFVSKLPKAGHWLIWVERFFAVILLGFAFFYFSLAFYRPVVKPPVESSTEIRWIAFSPEKMQNALKNKIPIVIDFYADWCLECHELDKRVFKNPMVIQKLKQVAALRVDATNFDDPLVQKLVDQYSIIGLPTVLFLDPVGQELKDIRMEGAGSLKEFADALKVFADKNHFEFQFDEDICSANRC